MSNEKNNPAEATALEAKLNALQQENQRLKRGVEELSFLNDLARAIGASTNLQEILQTISHRTLQAIRAEQGVITLINAQASDPTKTLVRDMGTAVAQQPFRPHQMLLGWMHRYKTPLLLNDPRGDERFRGVNWDEAVASLVCVPLMVKSELKGVFTVYNKKDGKGFTEDDQRLMTIIAGQSAQVIENARLYDEEQKLFRMQEQVRLAAKIQFDLLPKKPPQVAGYDIAGTSLPAQSVGGDYFDFIPCDGDRLAICLGDVTGKGLPASLLMANLQATIRSQTLADAGAKMCLTRANKLLCQSTDKCNFITFFYGILNPQNHQFTYANAGHNPPWIISANKTHRPLDCRGLVLGIREHVAYEEKTVDLQTADLLVIYSDGIVEAMNSWQEEFGDDRLLEVVRENYEKPASVVIEKIVHAVKQHADKAPQSDDITLVVVKRMS
jgi:sigma-B regulation protein RsbU (phosphoserine phosphatase)